MFKRNSSYNKISQRLNSASTEEIVEEQSGLLAKQDDELEKLSASMLNMREIANAIYLETSKQNKMLDDLTHNVDRTYGRTVDATRAVKKIQEEMRCSCTIS